MGRSPEPVDSDATSRQTVSELSSTRGHPIDRCQRIAWWSPRQPELGTQFLHAPFRSTDCVHDTAIKAVWSWAQLTLPDQTRRLVPSPSCSHAVTQFLLASLLGPW